jgi:hypothetical protein
MQWDMLGTKLVYFDQKLELHREILKTADTVHDEQEREKLLMTSSVYAGNKKVSSRLFKRPPRFFVFILWDMLG